MSYATEKLVFGKEHIYIVEIDLEYCSLVSGVGPCTATETGDDKCYNTRESSNDLPNFDAEVKTYRFCEKRSPHPIGLDAISSLRSVNISPSKIDLAGGLGVRASVSLSFVDHPHSDIQIDKYVDDRTYIASDRGTFWTKLRARNPNYQFRNCRVLSGYLVNGVFISSNFETRYYVIESMTASDGMASIIAKDPLKLASAKKAQAPAPSTGTLDASITSGAVSLTLDPAGVGNAEYPASGKVLIKSEVISFTRVADVLTLTRAQNNTIAAAHDANDTVQLCLEYVAQELDFIVDDLLTNYANISPSFINSSAWNTEVSTYLSGLLTGIIVKPFDVFKLLKELAESMPHYLWWDEKNQTIELTALKAPPPSANVLDMDSNLIKKTFSTKDMPNLRESTIFVNFGQFDPTKRLDEIGNYQQTYARIDTDSIAKYGSSQIKVINSRWITNLNKAAALQLGALRGRRFSDIPREINFSLEAKDSDVWIGQSRAINHRDIVDFSGLPIDTIFQIMSAKESENFNYTALEFTYGESLPEDEGGGDPDVDLIIISADDKDINLRTIYNGLFPAPGATTQAKFVIEGGVKVGSTSNGTFSINTGSWPANAEITLQTNVNALAAGKGGDGEDFSNSAEDGGPCLILNHDLILINNGIIGGGGGGGGIRILGNAKASGGGGAGFEVGPAPGGNQAPGGTDITSNIHAQDGTDLFGGDGGHLEWLDGGEPFTIDGGDGGDLGDPGQTATNAGGIAGIAIDKNGFVLTETVTGDIRGSIIA